MSLNATPSSNRVHIGFYGRRNAGKSSVVNAVTGQQISVVSDTLGTTTDPVTKAMELLPLGPVVIIDTPGYDDEGDLGSLRVSRTRRMLNKTDIAVLVVDAQSGFTPVEEELEGIFKEKKIPYIVVFNKCDLALPGTVREDALQVSAATGQGIDTLKEKLGSLAPSGPANPLIGDLLEPGDMVVLVTPIDESAPKGRIILPQQQMLRGVLDAGAMAVVTRETELGQALSALGRPPKMVITDSQAFKIVSQITPVEVPLTSFSILMARYKGFLDTAVEGVAALANLKDGDTVLISEGCTHHRQCNDIGTIKIPGWIEKFTGVKPSYSFTSGGEFPEDVRDYALVVHCGGCMLNEAEMKSRIARCASADVPIVNYGVAIAQMHGILRRSLQLFPDVLALLD